MLDLNHCLPLPRSLAALALLWLSACGARPATAAYFELMGAPDQTACDVAPPGELRLQGLDAPARAQVSGAELCAGAPIQRELPPGLYTLSWQRLEQADALDTGEASPLRGSSVVSLFAGQITRVHVQVETTPSERATSPPTWSRPSAQAPPS